MSTFERMPGEESAPAFAAAARGAAGPVVPRGSTEPAPLSFAQERFWLLSGFEHAARAYHVVGTYRLRGPLDVRVFERAVNELVRRHHILRTTFRVFGGQPQQVVEPYQPVPLRTLDLTSLPVDTRLAEAERRLVADARRTFDLTRSWPVRFMLVELGPGDYLYQRTTHHIASDRWSSGVLTRELSAIYRAFREGRPSPLADPPLQYADYAVWQREAMSDARLASQAAYWRTVIGTGAPVLDLPLDRPRPPGPRYVGRVHRFGVPAAVVDRVRGLARSGRASPFMVFLAGFKALLHRCCHAQDLAVGTPVAGRTRTELEPLIGCFLNTLVLRTDVSGDPTFRELVGRVRDIALAAYSNQDVPLERMASQQAGGHETHARPFEVMLIYQNVGPVALDLADVTAERIDIERGTSMVDLTLCLVEEPSGMRAEIEYSTDLFDRSTIDRFARHYLELLRAASERPDLRLSELPLMGEAERHQILVEWNETAAPIDGGASLDALVKRSLARTPDRLAVYDGREKIDAGELARRASAVASALRMRGLAAGSVVAIATERSAAAVAGILGILEAGCVYLPLDVASPAARLALMLDDAKPGAVLASESARHGLPPGAPDTIPLDDILRGPALGGSSAPPAIRVSEADRLAYVIFTSGSTGRPRGVMGTHRGMVNRLAWARSRYPFAAGEVCAQKTSLGFVDSIAEIFGPLVAGVPLIVIGDEAVTDPIRLVAELRAHGVTRIVAVPSLIGAILDSHERLADSLPLTTLWFSSGEPLSRALAERFFRQAPHARLVNLYGASEASADSTGFEVPASGVTSSVVPIGRPIANTRVYVVDRELRPQPIGVSGELCIAGVGLAAGYLHRPDDTAARFVADPFAAGGSRLYRTGDRARWRADGVLECLGRLDDQIKIRGHRVEPAEIETALVRHPAIALAVVTAVCRDDDTRLVGHIVLRPGAAHPATAALRSWLLDRLPPFMVPSDFVIVDRLPTTPSGKIDKRSLPAPRPAVRTEDPLPPRDDVEARLLEIWRIVLARPGLGVTDDFFDAGGHSLVAVRLFLRIHEAFGKRLPPTALLRYPTVRELAAAVRASQTEVAEEPLVAIQPYGSRTPMFLIHAITGRVLIYRELSEHLGPDQPLYGIGRPVAAPPRHGAVTIEDLAEAYIGLIKQVQPTGPYVLGGLSAGGLIAYEMACRLRAGGGAVDWVFLLDSAAPGGRRIMSTAARLHGHLRGLDRLGRRDTASYLVGRLAGRVLRMGRAARFDLASRWRTLRNRPGPVWAEIRRAVIAYRPGRYDGRVLLFRCSAQPDYAEAAADLGWGTLVPRLEIAGVAGAHDTMLRPPNVQVMADRMTELLDGDRP